MILSRRQLFAATAATVAGLAVTQPAQAKRRPRPAAVTGFGICPFGTAPFGS